MDWRHLEEILEAGRKVYSELKNLFVWAKTNAGQGSFYRSQHELIFVFKKGDAAHTIISSSASTAAIIQRVGRIAGVNSFRAGRPTSLAIHPTVKPVALVADAMRDCSRARRHRARPLHAVPAPRILAAERVGRRAYGLEIHPLYVDAADPPLAKLHQARRDPEGILPSRSTMWRLLVLRESQRRTDE